MGRAGRTAALVLVSLAWAAASGAAGLALEGRLHTEGSAEWVRVQAWPTGEASLDRDPLAGPLVEAKVAPGAPFSVSLPEGSELPVRVEVDAPGHVGACIDVALPEQLELQPLWLPAGEPLEITVTEDGTAVKGARVWGPLEWSVATSTSAGRWSPCLASTTTGASGRIEARTVRRSTGGDLTAVGTGGHWGRVQGRTLRSPVNLRLDSRAVRVAVRDDRDRPVAGTRVADSRAPAGLAAVTDETGGAEVEVVAEGDLSLVALGRGMVGRRLLHGAPRGTVTIRVAAVGNLDVDVVGSSRSMLVTGWLPPALTPTVRPAPGGSVRVPWIEEPSGCLLEAAAPSRAPQSRLVATDEVPIAVALAREARVEGTVVDGEGHPVAGIPVWLEVAPAWSRGRRGMARLSRLTLPVAVSDARGAFSIPDLEGGDAKVVATRAGSPEASSEPLDLKPGSVEQVRLVLEPGHAVSLRVTDASGLPLPGATADGFIDEYGAGAARFAPYLRWTMPPDVSAASDTEGRTKLVGLPKGKVAVRVTLPGFAPTWRDATLEDADADLGDVVLSPGAEVRGRVLDAAGEPVAGAGIVAQKDPAMLAEGASPLATSDASGGFALHDLPPTGELWLEASADGMVPAEPQHVTLPADEPVELRVRPARRLEGRVVDEAEGEPIAGAQVLAQSSIERPIGGGRMFATRSLGSATTDDEGRFVIDDLRPGHFQVRATATSYRDLEVEAEIPEAETARPVTLPLAKGLEIRGRLVDAANAPVPGVAVTCRPVEGFSRAYSVFDTRPFSGPDGEFLITGLAPGRYQLDADGEAGAHAKAQADAGAKGVLLRLEPPGGILARVVDPDGEPVPGAELTVMGADDRIVRTADGRGEARVELLTPGTWRVYGEAKGWAMARSEVSVEAGKTAETTLRLEPSGVVIGTVLGLEPEELHVCRITGGRGVEAQPDGDGRFRLEGVRIGRVQVTGWLWGDGRKRTVATEVTDAEHPAEVEIDFSTGVTLSGRVLRGRRGFAGSAVTATPPGGREGNSVTADDDGRFEIRDLDPGPLEVVARDLQGRPVASKSVTAESDTWVELEVPDGELSGLVISKETRRPVVAASITVRSEDPPLELRARSDGEGRFSVSPLEDGQWTVRVEADGYTTRETPVTLSGGSVPELTVELEPEQALELIVHEADGTVPDRVRLVANAAAGDAVASAWVACDRDGRARVRTIPPGTWVILVQGLGGALLTAQVPSRDVNVVLQPTGVIEILVPIDAPPPAWRVRLIQAGSGLVMPGIPYASSLVGGWWSLDSGADRSRIPAGAWTVEALDPSGQAHRYDVQVTAGGTATVRLE